MKVRFLRNFDWDPEKFNGRLTVAFKAGVIQHVTRACAAKAIAAGAAEVVEASDAVRQPE